MSFVPIIDVAQVKEATSQPKFATVVDNMDPKKLGRVKVNLPGLFEGENAEALPWIRRKTDTIFCGQDCEIFDVPEKGSVVEVRWDYDNQTPVYSGAPYSVKHQTKEFTNNYPNEAGIKFGPHVIKFDKASKILTIENGQAQILLDAFGDCAIACNTFEVKCDRDALVKAPQIVLDGNVKVTKALSVKEGASGAISLNTIASVSGGLVTSIKSN